MVLEYSFHVYNKMAQDGASMALDKLLRANFREKWKKKGAGTRSEDLPPVVVCIGSDLAIGDSLGPIVGSMLKYKTQGTASFLYGTLASPITAKEIKYMRGFLQATHPDRQIIAVDAAVGEKGDVGLMKLSDTPLCPGAGANKRLGELGDLSVMGIVAEKSLANYGLFNTTRLNLVYSMAEILSDALACILWERAEKSDAKISG